MLLIVKLPIPYHKLILECFPRYLQQHEERSNTCFFHLKETTSSKKIFQLHVNDRKIRKQQNIVSICTSSVIYDELFYRNFLEMTFSWQDTNSLWTCNSPFVRNKCDLDLWKAALATCYCTYRLSAVVDHPYIVICIVCAIMGITY